MKKIIFIILIITSLFADLTRDSKTEIVYDEITNLSWQDDDIALISSFTWTQANEYCQSLVGNWHLPNYNELRTIIDDTRVNPSMDPIFNNTASSRYWSYTEIPMSIRASTIDFYDGSGDIDAQKSNLYNIRCVHNGKVTQTLSASLIMYLLN